MRELPKGNSVFLLGGRGRTASRAAAAIKKSVAGVSIAGATEGYRKIKIGDDAQILVNDEEDRQLSSILDRTRPAIVLVSFGYFKQECWISSRLLQFPSVRVYMGVGGALDFFARNIKRSPLWLRAMGLEWLWRLIMEPFRIRRIFTAVVVFPILLLKDTLYRIELDATT